MNRNSGVICAILFIFSAILAIIYFDVYFAAARETASAHDLLEIAPIPESRSVARLAQLAVASAAEIPGRIV